MASLEPEPSAVQVLPPELLFQIFTYLSGRPALSDEILYDEPSPTMVGSDHPAHGPLKTISLVSKRWRITALPLLFQHVVWAFDRWDLLLAESGHVDGECDPVSALPLLDFLRANNLGPYVDTLTLVVGDSMQGMYRLLNADPSPDTTGPFDRNAAAASAPRSTPPRPISLADAQGGLGGGQRPNRQERDRSYGEDSNWFWELLFQMMDPTRFTMIASPRMLASLLSRMLFVGDAWSFKNQWHILSLSREGRKRPRRSDFPSQDRTHGIANVATLANSATRVPTEPTPTAAAGPSAAKCHAVPRSIDSILFTVRPWTSLLLNEGSSTPVYTTYEFFLKRPPSILGALLGCEEAPNDRRMIPPSVRSFAYVAIFPLSSHFSSLVANLPPLDRLFVQLVPRSGVLEDAERMRCIDPGDLWMERNTCYSLVMRRLFDGAGDWDQPVGPAGSNWMSLREFESGDAADKEAWDMAVHYVRMSTSAWRVEREGIFVKVPPGERRSRESSESPDSTPASPFPGAAELIGAPQPGQGFDLLSVKSAGGPPQPRPPQNKV